MTASLPQTIALALNGRQTVTAAQSLADLLAEQGYGDAKVATAINGEFVPKRAWSDRLLASGDRVEVVSIRQGG